MRVNYQVSIDCADPHLLARFWSQALGWTIEEHHDRIQELIAQGYVTEADVITVGGRMFFKEAAAVRDPEAKVAPDGLPERGRMLFQVVPEGNPDELRTGFTLGTSNWRGFPTGAGAAAEPHTPQKLVGVDDDASGSTR